MKKRLCSLVMILVMVFTLCQFNMTKTYAAMADEATDYELGETYTCGGPGTSYFKVIIPEKSHVSLSVSASIHPDCTIYTTDGKTVLNANDLRFEQDFETGMYNVSSYRVLSAGTYYLGIAKFGYDSANVSFCIQAEKQITLPKGSISSVKSSKKGQMTVKCASSDDAVGYRIQYSTSDKFKSVKTVYSPTATATVTGLKAGQRYYVKACPYTVYDDGTRVYGQNSYVKTVKIKK